MTAKTLVDCADEWKLIPWKKFQKIVLRLQHRIYKARKKNDYILVKRLQSLLLGSKCAKYLAAREVSQLFINKKVLYGDNFYSSLVSELNLTKNWKHKKLRELSLVKTNGKKLSLCVPTIRDGAINFLISYALEPFYKAYFSNESYNSNWQVHNHIAKNLELRSKEVTKTILELNIQRCFDEIDNEKLLSFITLPRIAKRFISSALKVGILKNQSNDRQSTQSNLISSFLRKIILHGIENLSLEKECQNCSYQSGFRHENYMIFIVNTIQCVEPLINKVKYFLQKRGLKPDELTTKLVSSINVFEFRGWYFKIKAKNYKFVSYPSKKNRLEMIKKIKITMKDIRYTLIDRLCILKRIYTKWKNHHKFCDMSQVNLWSIDKWTYKYLKKKTKMPRTEIIKHLNLIFK